MMSREENLLNILRVVLDQYDNALATFRQLSYYGITIVLVAITGRDCIRVLKIMLHYPCF